jgi:hypothetical protein
VKFNTFRNLLVVAAIGVPVAGLVAYGALKNDAPPPAAPTPTMNVPALPPAGQRVVELRDRPALPTAPPPATGVPQHEAYLLSVLGKPASADKIKDAVPGATKVNVYGEGGVWARAKVDFDRDEKWDEKWTFSPGGVERQVAPADDEAYAEVWVHQNGAWTKK